MKLKGIILSGGKGTRLYPVTKATSKQLLPVYNKPMIYYALSTLLMIGIKDILIITTPEDLQSYKRLFGNGKKFGIKISFKIQKKPKGLADAFILGKKFIGQDPVTLILGDNIFFGADFSEKLNTAKKNCLKLNIATVFGYPVKDPNRYGVIEFDKNNKPLKIIEKPKKTFSNIAVTGLYFYPNDVIKKALKVKPSKRGELEITSINSMFLKEKRLEIIRLGKGYAWFDMGTFESLIDASNFVRTIEDRQGLEVANLKNIISKY
jgi:glucose-1-phosphate thymidylyltransferase